MSYAVLLRWQDGALSPIDHCDPREYAIEAADSWLVSDGTVFALSLHKSRFLDGAARRGFPDVDLEPFWDAAIAVIPREGDWFPRVELQSRAGAPFLLLRHRSAPELTTTLTVSTHVGPDPRTAPTIKGPDLSAMLHLRSGAQERRADEAVILTHDGYLIEGGTTSIVWWRGEILCAPPEEFDRVDSVTARSLFGLAAALGVETYREAATPAELGGTEVWALNALHGIRIVTGWINGPDLAAAPGRLALWRSRRIALRKPIDGAVA